MDISPQHNPHLIDSISLSGVSIFFIVFINSNDKFKICFNISLLLFAFS